MPSQLLEVKNTALLNKCESPITIGTNSYLHHRGRQRLSFERFSTLQSCYNSNGKSFVILSIINFTGGSHGALSGRGLPLSYGRRSRYDDYSSTRDRYGGGQKSYSSSQGYTYLSSRDRGGRQERGFPSLKDRVYPAPRESYSSSGCETSRGGHGGSRSERVGRNRY